MRPYFIVCSDFDRKSGGNRIVHQLCHELNEAGCKAFMMNNGGNPTLKNPLVTKQVLKEYGEKAIVIYPDLISGNPAGGSRIVRYYMNDKGFYSNYIPPGKDDIEFYFSENMAQGKNVLYIPSVDTKIFTNTHEKRKGIVYYVGKCRKPFDIPEGTEITMDYPSTQEELAELFNTSELFVSYVNTGLLDEARLCGCPTVLLKNEYAPYYYMEKELGTNGLVFSLSDIQQAKDTVHLFTNDLNRAIESSKLMIRDFIKKTQKPVPEKRTVSLDLHDFSVMRNYMDLLCQIKDHYPDFKVSLFTIPFDFPFETNPMAKMNRERELKRIKENLDWIQIIPHGLSHMPREMEKCDKETFKDVLKSIDEIFTKDGLPYEKGFCAPYWLWNQDIIDVLNEQGWWGAIDKNQNMLRPKKFYQYTHSIHEPFWNSDSPVLNLHGHIDGQSNNDLDLCFLNMFKLPSDTKFTFITDYLEE